MVFKIKEKVKNKIEDKKVIKKFAIFPTKINSTTIIWLEKYYIQYELYNDMRIENFQWCNYTYDQKNSKYIELKVESVSQPIQTGYVHSDYKDKSPKFEAIVTFDSRKLTDDEIENVENCKDVIYDLVIRKSLKGEIILKINGKELEFNKYFKIANPFKRINEIDDMFNRFYEKLVIPIGKILDYEPSRDSMKLKNG